MTYPITTRVLLLLLLFQGLSLAVFLWRSNTVNTSTAAQFAGTTPTAHIEQLRIGDAFDNETVLVKSGKQWLVRNLGNLPADAARVEALLQQVAAGKNGWAVAHSQAARQRFDVGTEGYQRRLSMTSNAGQTTALYLGRASGLHTVYARFDAQDDIYSIMLNVGDIAALPGRWLDTSLLQVRAPVRITTDLYSLFFHRDGWQSGSGAIPQAQELASLLSALKTIQISGVASEDRQRDLAAMEADALIDIQGLAENTTLALYAFRDTYYMHSSAHPFFFKVSALDYNRLTEIDLGRITGEKID